MNKLKAAWNWVKEKWWIPLSGVVVLGVALLFRPKTTSLHEFMKNDRELEKETNKHINELEEATDKEAENIRQQTKASVKKVRTAKGKKLEQINKNKRELEDALSQKTNEELAEMLRKEDEV
jgi:biopolymer transport protein ExbB/TolQ